MADVPAWVPIVSALAGGALVGAINFAMRWQDRKAEGKRHLRELIFKAAIEEWKQHWAFAIESNKVGKKAFMQPLLAYLVHQMKLSDVLLEAKITKENLSTKLAEVDEIMDEYKKFMVSHEKDSEKNTA
jgi:hypothetical protein